MATCCRRQRETGRDNSSRYLAQEARSNSRRLQDPACGGYRIRHLKATGSGIWMLQDQASEGYRIRHLEATGSGI
jgi:hypothetical protein